MVLNWKSGKPIMHCSMAAYLRSENENMVTSPPVLFAKSPSGLRPAPRSFCVGCAHPIHRKHVDPAPEKAPGLWSSVPFLDGGNNNHRAEWLTPQTEQDGDSIAALIKENKLVNKKPSGDAFCPSSNPNHPFSDGSLGSITPSSMERSTRELTTGWSLKQRDDQSEEPWLPVAQVPSQVHIDLLANKMFASPATSKFPASCNANLG